MYMYDIMKFNVPVMKSVFFNQTSEVNATRDFYSPSQPDDTNLQQVSV